MYVWRSQWPGQSQSNSSKILVWEVLICSYEAMVCKQCRAVANQIDLNLVVKVTDVGLRLRLNSSEILEWKVSLYSYIIRNIFYGIVISPRAWGNKIQFLGMF